MSKFGRPLVGFLAAGALLLAAGPATASSAERPFTATFSGRVAMPSPTTGTFDGAGLASHMGRISTDGDAVITGLDESTCPGGLANVHVETLTAANGDTLTITSLDVACPVGPGAFEGSGHWTVTGGTGRFADATGAGTFVGSLDLGAGSFTITLKGTVALGG
jgi:hypothetical protein